MTHVKRYSVRRPGCTSWAETNSWNRAQLKLIQAKLIPVGLVIKQKVNFLSGRTKIVHNHMTWTNLVLTLPMQPTVTKNNYPGPRENTSMSLPGSRLALAPAPGGLQKQSQCNSKYLSAPLAANRPKANARLIAAAPALLSNLQYIELVAPTDNPEDTDYVSITITGKALKDIRAAIAQAEGEV